jgi:hypothetical protein
VELSGIVYAYEKYRKLGFSYQGKNCLISRAKRILDDPAGRREALKQCDSEIAKGLGNGQFL